jgi:hypothetical protein
MNKTSYPKSSRKMLPRLSNPLQLELSPLQVTLLQNVHRGYTEIILEKEFGGGFSHARVFLVVPIKTGGARAARLATKTGEAKDLRAERDKYQAHVAPDVPFNVAQVREYYEQEDQAALNYVFAGGQALGQTVSLKEYYRSHTAPEVINTLTGLLEKALGSMWYGQGHPYNCPFRAEYGRHLPDDLEKILKIVFPNLSPVEGDRVQIPGVGGTYPHPLKVYPSLLDKMLEGRRSIVHGDLHLLNVLVDENGKGWLIDFAKVQERHNLFDFIKLETYVRLTALAAEQGAFSWGEYLQFEEALNAAAFGQLAAPPTNPILAKAYEVIHATRKIAQNYVGHPQNFKNEYLPGLFLYSLAMTKYYESNGPAPTQFAFLTACVAGQGLMDSKTENVAQVNSHPPDHEGPQRFSPQNPSVFATNESIATFAEGNSKINITRQGSRPPSQTTSHITLAPETLEGGVIASDHSIAAEAKDKSEIGIHVDEGN